MKRLLIIIAFACAASLTSADNIRFTAPEPGEPLVRFAVIGDLTGGERAGVFDAAVSALEQLKPDFILSVGDLIEGGTEDVSQMQREWDAFTARMAGIDTPFYPLVGNHDISNIAMREWWESSVGPRYYHFRQGDYLFLMLDSEDFSGQKFAEIKSLRNQAITVYKSQGKEAFFDTEYARLDERRYGVIRKEQSNYFLQVLEDNDDARWVFVLMHKPLWDSESSGFAELERALGKFSYTVINGHEHSYYHESRGGNDYVQMGTTGGEFAPKVRGEYMDHVMWVTLSRGEPAIINLKLEGILDKAGVPLLARTPPEQPDVTAAQHGNSEEAVYVIGAVTVTDPEKLQVYQAVAQPIAHRVSGYTPLAFEQPQLLEGELPLDARYFVERFSSMDELETFLTEIESSGALELRDSAANVHFMLTLPAYQKNR